MDLKTLLACFMGGHPFGDGYARPPGQHWRVADSNRNLQLKPALQAQLKMIYCQHETRRSLSVNATQRVLR